MSKAVFDHIFVGTGSTACVLPNRLTENPDVSVLLLLEAGESDRTGSNFLHPDANSAVVSGLPTIQVTAIKICH